MLRFSPSSAANAAAQTVNTHKFSRIWHLAPYRIIYSRILCNSRAIRIPNQPQPVFIGLHPCAPTWWSGCYRSHRHKRESPGPASQTQGQSRRFALAASAASSVLLSLRTISSISPKVPLFLRDRVYILFNLKDHRAQGGQSKNPNCMTPQDLR
jgi:hypothetical protein